MKISGFIMISTILLAGQLLLAQGEVAPVSNSIPSQNKINTDSTTTTPGPVHESKKAKENDSNGTSGNSTTAAPMNRTYHTNRNKNFNNEEPPTPRKKHKDQ